MFSNNIPEEWSPLALVTFCLKSKKMFQNDSNHRCYKVFSISRGNYIWNTQTDDTMKWKNVNDLWYPRRYFQLPLLLFWLFFASMLLEGIKISTTDTKSAYWITHAQQISELQNYTLHCFKHFCWNLEVIICLKPPHRSAQTSCSDVDCQQQTLLIPTRPCAL